VIVRTPGSDQRAEEDVAGIARIAEAAQEVPLAVLVRSPAQDDAVGEVDEGPVVHPGQGSRSGKQPAGKAPDSMPATDILPARTPGP